jgi:hypothetical protein
MRTLADKPEDETDSPDREAEEPSGSCIDDDFAGRHGTVASESSLKDEKQITLHPETPGGRWSTRFAESPTMA